MSRGDDHERVERALRGTRLGVKWARVPCPFCEDEGHRDKKTSLGVNARSGVYHCFRCGTSGKLSEPPDPSAAHLPPEPEVDREVVNVMEPPPGFYLLDREPGASALSFAPARRYLRDRHVTPSMLHSLQIGACDADCEDKRWAGRVIVPMLLKDKQGWIGWVGRIWTKKAHPSAWGLAALPYLYPPGMPRGVFLYNHDALHVETDEPLIIVEGVFDTFPFWPHAAAVLGKASHLQMEALRHAKRPVAIVMDGDAWVEGQMMAARLRFEGVRAGHVKLPPRKDPDEMIDHVKEQAKLCIDRSIF